MVLVFFSDLVPFLFGNLCKIVFWVFMAIITVISVFLFLSMHMFALLFYLLATLKNFIRMFCFIPAAIQCMKKKKLHEAKMEQLGNFELQIHDQVPFLN